MKLLSASILVVLVFFLGDTLCQVNYVPAQILIPTFNGSYYPQNNYSGGYYNNQASYNRPPAYGFHVNNHTQYNGYNRTNNTYNTPDTSYIAPKSNGSSDGHLNVGDIQTYDRLLFNQVGERILLQGPAPHLPSPVLL